MTSEARAAFELAPDRLPLNHGSFGAVPRVVREEQDRWRAHIERDPTSFYAFELPALLRAGANGPAKRFGGESGDWVFCENATAAVSSVLHGLQLGPGDEIVTTSHAYGAVLQAMRWIAARTGAALVLAELPAILTSEDEVAAAVERVLGPRTRLLVVDHITSASAAILPVARLATLARHFEVPVLVDGAHAPGHIALDVPALGVDWYTGNAHKWLFAPRGCGLLWTAPARQAETRPAVLSHGTDKGYTEAFDWIGTRDPSAWLCFDTAAAAHDGFGGAALMAGNRAMAAQGAAHLVERLGLVPSAPASMRGAMAALTFGEAPDDPELPNAFRRALTAEHGVVAPISVLAGKLWLRISAQIYNAPEDYERCATAVAAVRRRFNV
ncbi:MAG TPA: aminotransferase class V-fold PLP-dependent enzyme [Rhizomicrobium sp.]|jgi:isopenicillin-N epimerase